MEQTYKIKSNQNIFDVALQKYGSVQNIYDIIVDNDLEGADTMPVAGTEIVFNSEGKGNELMKKEIKTKRMEFANGQDAGSYNFNFNPDFD